jgi:hypothetical protein
MEQEAEDEEYTLKKTRKALANPHINAITSISSNGVFVGASPFVAVGIVENPIEIHYRTMQWIRYLQRSRGVLSSRGFEGLGGGYSFSSRSIIDTGCQWIRSSDL